VVDGGLGGRAIMVGVGIGGCQVLGLHNGCGMIEDMAVVVAHAFRHRLMHPRVLRRACGSSGATMPAAMAVPVRPRRTSTTISRKKKPRRIL